MRVLLVLCLLFAACGKVGDPLPPFIRIPEPIKDLTVTQSGHDLVLTWTNPARNIDGSAATDLARVQIRSGGAVIATLDAGGAGKPQSHSIVAGAIPGSPRTFAAVVETMGQKVSDLSNAASIVPVEVPGVVQRLRFRVDQRRIVLEWDAPREHPELADAYLVVRAAAAPQRVSGRRYEDNQYEPGKVVTYEVTPVRQSGGATIRGAGPVAVSVTVEDKTPPRVPSGLEVIASDTGAFLTWDANEETDLAGYRVFRSEGPDTGFVLLTDQLRTGNSFFDAAAKAGFYYAVSAVDEFRNESARSAPFRVP